MTKLGATGAFPDGKLDKTDEGEIQMSVSSTSKGLVRIDFGKPVAWLAMSPSEAEGFAALIKSAADRVRRR